jgi:hypothetical protein
VLYGIRVSDRLRTRTAGATAAVKRGARWRAAREPLTARRRGGYPIRALVLIQPAIGVRFDGGNSSRTSSRAIPRSSQRQTGIDALSYFN